MDWSRDAFMSEWDKTYVSTNVKPGATAYSKDLFLRLNERLATECPELNDTSCSLIAVVCCAVGRADIVGRFFDDLSIDEEAEKSAAMFLRIREAITIVFPFLGMPKCIPACHGLIGVVRRKGEEFASIQVLREPKLDDETVQRGMDLRRSIYKDVGNGEIFGFMDRYFKDLFTCSAIVTWAYLISKANEVVFKVTESHLIVASAIIALGATRQARSHIKATLSIGNSVECVKLVQAVIVEIASWAGQEIEALDIDALIVR